MEVYMVLYGLIRNITEKWPIFQQAMFDCLGQVITSNWMVYVVYFVETPFIDELGIPGLFQNTIYDLLQNSGKNI